MLSNGEKIGPYTIRERAGAGGMATVYKAWHEGLHRHEALKVPRGAGEGSADSAYVLRLLTEARVAARLHHPNIVAIHNVSEPSATIPFFAMDWVQGEDLAQILKIKKQFSLHQTIEILLPVAKALDYAHSQGVVHRDIKPANILLENKGGNWIPHVVDFGISRAAEDEEGATKLTKSGMMVGTPEYMSPEQVGSGEIIDFRTDIYSLGVVAYEMLCGTPPFTAGEGVSRLSILVAHVNNPAPLFERCPDFPLEVGEVLLRALAKSPKDRPQSCTEFIEQLQTVASTIPIDDLLPSAISPTDTRTPFDNSRFHVDNDATIVQRLPIAAPVVASPLAELTTAPPRNGGASSVPPTPTGIEAAGAKATTAEATGAEAHVVDTRPETLQTLRSRLEAARVTQVNRASDPAISDARSSRDLVPALPPQHAAAIVKRAPVSRLSIFIGCAAIFLVLGTTISLSMRRWQTPATASSVEGENKPKAQVSISRAIATDVEKQKATAPARLRTVRVTRMREIPFPTEIRRTSNRLAGQKAVVQQGRPGTREVVLAITMQGEREMTRDRVSQRDVLQPLKQIVELGTRRPQPKPAVRRPRVQSSDEPARRETWRTTVSNKRRATKAPRRRYVREAPLPP